MTERDEPGRLMIAEIGEQPEVLARLLDHRDEIAAVRARLAQHEPRFVLFAARGTSDHAALYGKYLVEVDLAKPAGLVSPSTLTVYGSRPDLSGVLMIAVSQSGGSPDLVDSLTAARSCGALTVAVTNAPSSPLASAAELHVDIHAGAERAVAATKSYTAQLLALHLLLVGDDGAELLPERAAATLAGSAAVQLASRYRFADRLITTARGYSYATAREAALKLMETSYLSAQAFSAADLLHGPLAMIDSGVPVIAVVSPGRGGHAMTQALDRLSDTGADIARIGPVDGVPVVSDDVPERLLPILEILPLQQLAWRLALDRGTDPDRPRGLRKVTSTW
jgi:glutamine---fructose-6-phosphate transaminase (isomerizing)